jgi:hypothetical protein
VAGSCLRDANCDRASICLNRNLKTDISETKYQPVNLEILGMKRNPPHRNEWNASMVACNHIQRDKTLFDSVLGIYQTRFFLRHTDFRKVLRDQMIALSEWAI